MVLMAKKKKKKKASKSTKAAKKKPESSLEQALKASKKVTTETPLETALKTGKDMQQSFSLDSALNSSKQTQGDLQGLLQGVSDGTGYYHRKEEKRVDPQLSYESKNDIAEAYALEDVPLNKREAIKKRIPLIKPQEVAESKTIEKDTQTEETTTLVSYREEIYSKLEGFFEAFLNGYNERYSQWENSIGNILAILRKMRKVTKKNTEDLVTTINELFNKIHVNLDQFKIKRDETEKVADVNLLTMSGEFKKVLGMLELQVKEYQLKKLADDLIHQVSY